MVVAFIGYLQIFFDPIQQLSQLYTTYQQGMAALDKIFDLLDTEPDLVDKPDALDPRPLRGEIQLEGVWFSYGDGGGALSDERRGSARRTGLELAIHVPPGRRWRWSETPGAGKSTFAKLVARFYDPQRGRVLVDGHDLRDLRSAAACAASWESCRRRGSCSRGRCGRTSASGAPTPRDEEVEAAAARDRRRRVHRRLPAGLRRPRSGSAARRCRRASGS